MNRKFLILALTMPLALSASAQKITAKNQVIDCGQVLYQQPVTVQFELKNEDNSQLLIHDVKTSCGCTAAEYPHAAVLGNSEFKVSATYDARQMGHFEKLIAVYANAKDEPLLLTLKGVVVNELRHFAGNYQYSLGSIKADKKNIEFDDVNRGDRPYADIHIQNQGSTAATPVVMHLPKYLKGEVSPTTIAPGHSGVVRLTLLSSLLPVDGLTQTAVYLGAFPGDNVSAEKEIDVSAVILPAFQNLTEEQLAYMPQLRISTKNLDLGTFDNKKKKNGTIIIENVGRTTLNISALQMFTKGLEVSLNKSKLEAGEQAKLKITAVKKDLENVRSQPRVLMITNDPGQPKVVIEVNVK